jgi:ABC-type transporter Mla subunit MlaD
MKKPELEKILQQLKDELAASQFEKASSEKDLNSLIEKIEQALHDDEAAVKQALNEPLNDAVLRFEGSHPQLTSLLNSISSLLSNLGI